MSITTRALDEITAADLDALPGATPEPMRLVALPMWSRAAAATAAASLANTGGGLVIVGATPDPEGRVVALGGAPVTEADLRSVAQDLGAGAEHLLEARVLSTARGQFGLLAVAEASSPPVLDETTGAMYHRTVDGLVKVRSRADLESLLAKDRLMRARAEHNAEAMAARVAFGHFNYMTVSLIAAPRVATAEPYEWAKTNGAALAAASKGFAARWGLTADNVSVEPGEVSVALSNEVTGFIRVARNGCVAVGERQVRPPQERYLSPEELSRRLAEMAEVATTLFRAARPVLVLGALFSEGVRELRLPVTDGLTAPVSRDLVHSWLPERYLVSGADGRALATDLQQAAGTVFGADLVAGTGVAHAGPEPRRRVEPETLGGATKKTERRIVFAR